MGLNTVGALIALKKKKARENNETFEKNQNEIISTEGTPVSESPIGKEITTKTAKKTNDIKKEAKTPFESISETPEYNEAFKETIKLIGNYIDFELGNEFNKNQKENIKLILLNNISKKVNTKKTEDKSFFDKITNIISGLKEITTEQDKKNTKSKLKEFFKIIGINGLQEELDKQIGEIKKTKHKNTFQTLNLAFKNIYKTNEIPKGGVLKNIKDNFSQTNERFKEFFKNGSKLKKTAEKLGLGEQMGDLLKMLEEEFPLLGKILSFILGFIGGKEALDNKKPEKATANLKTLLENKEKLPLDKIEKNKNFKNKEKLNSEKLKSFYKYLDSQGIDYSKENFWQEFLTGKSKNTKIKELNLLLNKTIKSNLRGTQLKHISLKQFIEKLNSLSKIKEEERKKHNSEIEKQIEEAKKSGNTTMVEELKKEIKLSFEENLKKNQIDIPGKGLQKISIINNGKNIKIGENTYSISIYYFGERFEKISGGNGEYTIFAKTPDGIISKKISTEQIKTILTDLVNNNKVKKTVKVGKYNPKLTITPN